MGIDTSEQLSRQSKPIDQRIVFNQNPEQVWKERLSGIQFYHGTSESIAERVQQTGLSPHVKPYLPEDHEFLISILNKLDLSSDYAKGKDNGLYITSDLVSACDYAIDGPEMLRIFYLRSIDHIISAWDSGRTVSLGVTHAEMERIKQLRNKTIAFLNHHRPALVMIRQDSKALESILRERLETLYDLYKDPQAFAAHVKAIMGKNQGKTEKQVAEDLTNVIKTQFGEMRVSKLIPADELEVKKGKGFDELTHSTKTRAEIIRACFSEIEEQPAEVIHLLDSFIYYGSYSEKNIIDVCKYYNIDQNKTQRIVEGARRLKKEENK